jgi:putative flippase GtrA
VTETASNRTTQAKRFAIIGASNALLDLIMTYAWSTWVGIPYFWANFLSTTVCFAISFIANRHWAFSKNRENLLYQMVTFTAVSLFAAWIIQGLIVQWFTTPINQLLNSLGWNLDFLGLGRLNLGLILAKLLGSATGMVWNFGFYSTLVFGKLGDRLIARIERHQKR